MSYEAEKWARSQRVGNARAKQVLVELAYCLNDETGLCCPSRDYLHDVTELKAETISNATAHLEKIGLIKKHREPCAKGIRIRYELIGYLGKSLSQKQDKPKNGSIYRGEPENGLRGEPENGLRGEPENGLRGEPENGLRGEPENGLVTNNKNKEFEQEIVKETNKGSFEDFEAPLSEQIEEAQLARCESALEDPEHVLTSVQMVVLGKTLGVRLANNAVLQQIADRQTITVDLFKHCVTLWKKTAKGTGYLLGILRNASIDPESVKPKDEYKVDMKLLREAFADCGYTID